MGLFSKGKEDKDWKIKELMKELEEARKLTPTSEEVFNSIDFSELFKEADTGGDLTKALPFLIAFLQIITIGLLFIKLK